ncbi:Hypothetical protein CINCED_3A008545 [Cinara cedri]|nr:Hypothetical protein CINCED_3A008545 [Cinara cedri]
MSLTLYIIVTCIKLLCLPCFFSTDFEVHRNWLATTYSLPLEQWYSATHSPWTLDYPPLFAWFEYFLAQIAFYVDVDMLSIKNLNYESVATVHFQRLSVIVTDFVFYYGSRQCAQALVVLGMSPKTRKKNPNLEDYEINVFMIEILLVFNIMLMIIDHIHFQYNGFLFGILLVSIAHILKGQSYRGAFWFIVLLNFKHIYLYLAPVYFIYLLKHFCFGQNLKTTLKRLINLGIIVLGVTSISFGPFVVKGQITQVLKQLFPFKRGLSHAYWAPNFWAMYNTADIGAKFIYKKLDLINNDNSTSMTRGLVQEYDHYILPSITPQITFTLTAMFLLPCLYKMWISQKSAIGFVRCIVICGLTSFMFGWHVHEKALLIVIIPLTLLINTTTNDCSVFTMLSTIGVYSCFPLLFRPSQFITKLLLFCINVYFLYVTGKFKQLKFIENMYLMSLWPLMLSTEIVWGIFQLDKMYPFLPLMLTSFHNSIGVFYCWLKFYVHYTFN